MSENEINPNETLLEKALREQKGEAITDFDPSIYAKVELAVAYQEGKLYSSTIAKVIGIKASAVPAWAAGKLQQGIRRGYVTIKLSDHEELRKRRS